VLTAEKILGADDIKREKVMVPEWADSDSPQDIADAFVYVQGVSGKARDVWEHSSVSMRMKGRKADVQTNYANTRAKLLVQAICDANGKLLFNESQVEQLGEKSAAPLDRCFEVAQRLSGISEADIEALTKNSEATASAA